MEIIGIFRPVLTTTAATAASVTINPTGAKNAITYTAVVPGTGGNSITVEYVDPAASGQSLSVDVASSAITVNLATDGDGLITSTAAQIRTAIAASGPASALISTALSTADAGNDGSGVVTAVTATALTGGTAASSSGTYYLDGKPEGLPNAPIMAYEVKTGDLMILAATLGATRTFSFPAERTGHPVRDYS